MVRNPHSTTVTTLVKRIIRLSDACGGLHQKINSCLRRLIVLHAPLARVDVAEVHDRMNELFTEFALVTRSDEWHELDEDDREV